MESRVTQTPSLVGRAGEQAHLDRLTETVRGGRSAVLRIRGEPGVGKTALIGYALSQAAGWLVLAANGVESDTEMAFGTLAELVGPLADRLPLLPPSQAASLAGAVGLGPPMPGDPLAVAAATFGLLSVAAEHDPVVVVVDDAHWVDPASGHALRFAARRMSEEPVLLLIGERDTMPSPFTGAGLPELALQGLDERASRELLEATGVPLAPAVTDQLLETARGNPLALQAIPPLLDEDERAGRRPAALPLPPGEALTGAYRRRLEALSPQARDALVLLAAGAAAPEAVGAVRSSPTGDAALSELEAAGLVELSVPARFRHPLIRSVAYHDAPPIQRRAAHGMLAEAMEPSARQAWHRALAATDPDEEIAASLEHAALDWRTRGALASSAAAFEAAARLSPDEQTGARRRVEAGRDLLFAGELTRASELLSQAQSSATGAALATDARCLRARCALFAGDALTANALLLEAASSIERNDPSQAAIILAEAAFTCTSQGEFMLARSAAERASALASHGTPEATFVAAVAMGGILQATGHLAAAEAMLDELWPVMEQSDPLGSHHLMSIPVHAHVCFERYDRARLLIGRIVGAAREHSALSVLPSALVSLWSLEFRLGNWPQAEAASSEGARLAEETGQIAALPWLRGSLAVVEGALGRADASQENAERAREANLQVGTGTEAVLGWAAGLLANGSGRTEEAIEHLENAAREEEQRGFHDPTLFPWRPELIYAYVRAGRTVDAELMLSDFESLAEGTTLRWPRAAAARCRGLLADDDSFEPEFATALGWHQGLRMPFEQARTQLCLGERRIRARRRADARDPLRAALTTFERLGAATWAETARRELRATGLRIRSPQAEHEQRLTPRELEIALKVAEGLTNREVAASLFLSLKTVEHHLRIVFRKLDVRSRSQLAGLVAEHDPRLNAYPE